MKEGERILSDQIAGGAYYQSKPTAANGTVYFGTPARFVYAVDAESGKEKWKFELGGSISGAPTYDQGRILHRAAGSRRGILLPGCRNRKGNLEPENRMGLGLCHCF